MKIWNKKNYFDVFENRSFKKTTAITVKLLIQSTGKFLRVSQNLVTNISKIRNVTFISQYFEKISNT